MNDIWNQDKDTIEATAMKIVGTKRNVFKYWFYNICEEASQRRKVAREEWLKVTNNDIKRAKFATHRKETHNILRCEKRKYLRNLLERAEQDFKTNKTRDVYMTINNLRGDFKNNERFIRDSNVSLVTADEDITKEWV